MKNIEELKKIKDALEVLINESENTKFEVGKWYKTEIGSIYFLSKIEGENLFGYGLDSNNVWFDNTWLCEITDIKSLATPKEVEEALIKEAEKRGLKEGIKIKFEKYDDRIVITKGKLDFLEHENKLRFDYGTIFYNGEWAEIVKTKTIDEIARDLSILSEYGIINYMSSTENKQTIIETINNL